VAKSRCTFIHAFRRRFGTATFADVLTSSRWPPRSVDPAAWRWLEDFFERELQTAAQYSDDVSIDVFHAEVIDAGVLAVELRLIGDEQDPDTEVPARLAHNLLRAKLVEMGAATRGQAPAVHWYIKAVDVGGAWANRPVHTIYDMRATFRLADCTAKALGGDPERQSR
jgi:hypothetical protein